MGSFESQEIATVCLARIVARFANDAEINDTLCQFIENQLLNLIWDQSSLNDEVVTNVAVALKDIGDPERCELEIDHYHHADQCFKIQ